MSAGSPRLLLFGFIDPPDAPSAIESYGEFAAVPHGPHNHAYDYQKSFQSLRSVFVVLAYHRGDWRVNAV